MTSTRTRSRSTRPGPRSSPGPNDERTERTRRRHAGRRPAPPRRHGAARRPRPRPSVPRQGGPSDGLAPDRRRHHPRGNEVGDHPARPARPVAGLGGRRIWCSCSPSRSPDSASTAGRTRRQSTYPSWTASLRTGWVKHRAAQLQVSASPSFNVTVLELIPATPRRTGNRSFLRVGLPVIEELARRLEATHTQHCWKRGNDGRIRDR